jgi:hypothetical protein
LPNWDQLAASLDSAACRAGIFMVQGLRSGRQGIKFRLVLPAAAVLFVALSTWLYAAAGPHMVYSPPDVLYSASTHTRPAVIATAVNLPAFVIALPLELAMLGSHAKSHRYYEPFRTVEFSFLGMIFWFVAGRAIDDWIGWSQIRSGSRWRLSDCLFAALIAVESTMLAVLFAVGFRWAREELWYFTSSVAWALFGYWAFIFRVVQFNSYPKVKSREM